eukprot:gene32966-40691_t
MTSNTAEVEELKMQKARLSDKTMVFVGDLHQAVAQGEELREMLSADNVVTKAGKVNEKKLTPAQVSEMNDLVTPLLAFRTKHSLNRTHVRELGDAILNSNLVIDLLKARKIGQSDVEAAILTHKQNVTVVHYGPIY